MGLQCIFTTPKEEREKEPVISAVRSEAKLSPEASGEGLFSAEVSAKAESGARPADQAFSVRSAMPTAQALRLCPQATVLPPRHKVYREYSARMMTILSEYSPLIRDLDVQPFPLVNQAAEFPKQVTRRHPEVDASAVCCKRH